MDSAENTAACSWLFDRIYVVSLPSSEERRAYISDHLISAGILDFEFHDACDPQHSDVQDYIAAGKVHIYPPCFRCGKNSCGKDDCNNILIGPQIANFVTYLNLWDKIACKPQRALVVEDDLILNPYWEQVLNFFKDRVISGDLEFCADRPKLVRLGWALNEEHRDDTEFCLRDEVRMSNPCHAMTSTFARALLERFTKIDTTSDIYMHAQAPKPGEAVTIFPPMASELSWSVGRFQSLIHPKRIRADYLKNQGEADVVRDQKVLIQNHHMHMFYRKILIVGHPRTGTGYTASLLGQLGLDIGHERDGKDGISSWMFAVESEKNPYAQSPIAKSRKALCWEHLIHPVRNIAEAVPSIMRDNHYALPSYNFRRKHIHRQFGTDLDDFQTSFERAVQSLVFWTKMIRKMNPGIWFRIEDGHEYLKSFLLTTGLVQSVMTKTLDLTPVNKDKLYKGQFHLKPKIAPEDWYHLTQSSQEAVMWYCKTYGYPLPPFG